MLKYKKMFKSAGYTETNKNEFVSDRYIIKVSEEGATKTNLYGEPVPMVAEEIVATAEAIKRSSQKSVCQSCGRIFQIDEMHKGMCKKCYCHNKYMEHRTSAGHKKNENTKEIVLTRANGRSYTDIAKDFGLSRQRIFQICKNNH